MKVIPQGHLENNYSLEYLIRQYALFRFITSSVDSDYKVIVFDGMAVVNKIDRTKMNLKSCSDFASASVQRVKKEARAFSEVCVICEELGLKLFAIKFLMTLLLNISLLNNFCLI